MKYVVMNEKQLKQIITTLDLHVGVMSDSIEEFAATEKMIKSLVPMEPADFGPDLSEQILDQALKDQKDAERYMHLKRVITGKDSGKQLLVDKTANQIDELMDDRIRSYDQ